MKKNLLFFLFINLFFLFSEDNDYSKGPLYGKDMFLSYIIYLNFPGVRAKTENDLTIKFHTSVYFVNDFYVAYYDKSKIVYNSKENDYTYKKIRGYDYESLNIENGISVSFMKKFETGLHLRIISYYGGFLDNIIQTFHYIFGFPNGQRESFPQYDVYVDIKNDSNIKLTLNKPVISFGDIDFWFKYTIYQKNKIAFALINAIKFPTGQVNYLSGSGNFDYGFGLLLDLMPVRFISLYLQSFLILPFDSIFPFFDSNPYPMFHGIFNFSINLNKFLSFSVQLNFKTPSFKQKTNIPPYYYIDKNCPFGLVQLNILTGFILNFKNFAFQFYFEENPIYTSGVDIAFNFLFSYKLKPFLY